MSAAGCPTLLVSGGTRSGKSALGLRWAEGQAASPPTRRVFLATARSLDEETAARVARHQAERGPCWTLCEAPLDPLTALCRLSDEAPPFAVVLLDCVTMWLCNLLGENLPPADILLRVQALAQWLEKAPLPVALVTAEVGLGIVPVSPAGRQFRDLQGEANQILARSCQSVVLAACGLPLALKNTLPKELL